ncbi:MAG: cation:proton antiporter [Acidobacteriota bacterium]|nr:cation:proton antiporter [Acidobacteriota bacterium]
MRWFLFLVLAAFSWAARMLGDATVSDPVGSALLSLGILIIGGVLAGELAVRFRAPRITGYLVLGMVAGPHALGLETARDAQLLRIFEELALGLIALTAGGEFRLKTVRRRLRPLLALTAAHTVGILVLVAGGLWLVLKVVPFLGSVTPAETFAAVALLGVIAVAVSPSTTIAVIAELRARGEMVETVLSVTIIKDLVILLLFTLVNTMALSLLFGGAPDLGDLVHVGLEILGSLLAGAVLGTMLGLYIAKVGRLVPLTVLALALASAELAHQSWMEHLLVCMAAGFTARNLYPRAAGHFLDALEQSSTPVYVVFFALIGAGLNIRIFAALWLPALIYVLVRGVGVWLMTGFPASAAGSGRHMVRFGWMGFVAQAGLSLGLAARIQREIPGIGSTVATLVVAAVVVNQLVGPILWERAILAAGEQGQVRK